MKEQIEARIKWLEAYRNQQSSIIMGNNHAIEYENFRPSLMQKRYIDYVCYQGKWANGEIARLQKLLEEIN